MVSPTKRPFPAPPSGGPRSPVYTSVPTDASPDPNSPTAAGFNFANPAAASHRYSALSGASVPPSHLSPELNESAALFGRRGSDYMPAPSIMSRDSTHASLPGTPPLGAGNRGSWASGIALAGEAAAIAGAEGGKKNGRSGLAREWSGSIDRSSSDEDGQGHITPAVAATAAAAEVSEKPRWAQDSYPAPKKSRKGLWIGLGGVALLLVAGAAVGLGVGLTRNKSSKSSGSSSSSDADSSSGSSGAGTATGTASSSTATPTPTSGGQGSLITLDDGSTITYNNPFGGTWVWDESDPFNNGAQANSWTPALNGTWKWGEDKIYGVNLGGWLNTEPFIVPALYELYSTGPGGTAVDEYTLSLNMGDNLTAAMTDHYDTFITEKDFADIASAGLNWVRLPIGHWSVATIEGEPFLERVSWTYVLKAIQWARKYGIRINLDLHTMPGSQNGWNHSGKLGSINWMYGAMGLANAERGLDIIRTIAEFIAQPEYAPVVQLFGFVNEPFAGTVSQYDIGSFEHEAYNIIREITGFGEGNGPWLSVHDSFIPISNWYDFLPGADRLSLDTHPYLIFGDQPTGTLDEIAESACTSWATTTNTTLQSYGMVIAGEWSAAPNDCGLWINNVGQGARYDGSYTGYTGPTPGSCSDWDDWRTWNQSTIDGVLSLATNTMDALQNWFFWTWRIGNSTTGDVAEVNPFWHYKLGYDNGWIPKDPRSHYGACAAVGVDGNQFTGFSSPSMTGGAGAGTIAAAASASYPWPVSSLANVAAGSMSLLPHYTRTGSAITLPGPTFTSASGSGTIDAGNGWAQATDTAQGVVAISGCAYPSEYNAATLSPTAGACGAGDAVAFKKRSPGAFPAPTPAPAARR